MKKEKVKYYLILVFILLVFVLYFSLKDNYKNILEALSEVNILFLLIAIFFIFLSKYYLGRVLYLLAKKEKKDISEKDMIKIEMIYPFFAGITPSSLGGESFEIFYLKDCGISIGKSSNAAVQKFITYQISLLIFNTLAVLLNLFLRVVPFDSFVCTCLIISFIANIIITFFTFFVAYNKRFNHFIMNKGINIGHKLHLIKNIEKTKASLDSYLANFDEGVENLKKDKRLFVKLVGIQFLSYFFYMMTTFPIAVSLGITNVNVFAMFIISTFVKMMSILVITPGNTGSAEASFVYIFSSLTGLIGDAKAVAFMLIWRVVTYYIPLITGGIMALLWGRRKQVNE